MKKIIFCVYILIKNSNPIYVGMSMNLKKRLEKHRITKDFDNFIVIERFECKKQALSSERTLIKYLSLFGNKTIINGKYQSIEAYKNYIL